MRRDKTVWVLRLKEVYQAIALFRDDGDLLFPRCNLFGSVAIMEPEVAMIVIQMDDQLFAHGPVCGEYPLAHALTRWWQKPLRAVVIDEDRVEDSALPIDPEVAVLFLEATFVRTRVGEPIAHR